MMVTQQGGLDGRLWRAPSGGGVWELTCDRRRVKGRTDPRDGAWWPWEPCVLLVLWGASCCVTTQVGLAQRRAFCLVSQNLVFLTRRGQRIEAFSTLMLRVLLLEENRA